MKTLVTDGFDENDDALTRAGFTASSAIQAVAGAPITVTATVTVLPIATISVASGGWLSSITYSSIRVNM